MLFPTKPQEYSKKKAICPNKICIFKKKVVTLQVESFSNAKAFGTNPRIPADNVPPQKKKPRRGDITTL